MLVDKCLQNVWHFFQNGSLGNINHQPAIIPLPHDQRLFKNFTNVSQSRKHLYNFYLAKQSHYISGGLCFPRIRFKTLCYSPLFQLLCFSENEDCISTIIKSFSCTHFYSVVLSLECCYLFARNSDKAIRRRLLCVYAGQFFLLLACMFSKLNSVLITCVRRSPGNVYRHFIHHKQLY